MIGQKAATRNIRTPEWKFTVNTEATAAGEKKTGIPFNLYQQPGITLEVNWGDGTSNTLTESNYTVNDSRASVHEYASAGTYQVSIRIRGVRRAYILTINSNANISTVNNAVAPLYWWRRTLISVDNALPRLKGINYYNSPTSTSSLYKENNIFYYLFYRCSSLQSIPSGLFDKNTAVTGFYYCFYNCSSLQSIPSGLFDKNTAVTDFGGCFSSCTSIQSIPSGLFDKNTEVKDFGSIFNNCTLLVEIPAGLFDKNIEATYFAYCFYNCYKLASIPENIFKYNTSVTDIHSCFRSCSALTDFTLHIGSSLITNCSSFVTKKAGTTRTVYVPASSTTYTTFSNQATTLGLTIETVS